VPPLEGCRPIILRCHERCEVFRLRKLHRIGQLWSGQVGAARESNLSLPRQLVKGTQCLLDRGRGIRAVQVINIDPLGLEPLQARELNAEAVWQVPFASKISFAAGVSAIGRAIWRALSIPFSSPIDQHRHRRRAVWGNTASHSARCDGGVSRLR